MHLYFETHAAHADRFANTVLTIDHKFLRQDVQNFLFSWNRHSTCRFDHAIDITWADFLVLDSDHAIGVEAADVAASDPGVDILHLAVSHQFDFLDDF